MWDVSQSTTVVAKALPTLGGRRHLQLTEQCFRVSAQGEIPQLHFGSVTSA